MESACDSTLPWRLFPSFNDNDIKQRQIYTVNQSPFSISLFLIYSLLFIFRYYIFKFIYIYLLVFCNTFLIGHYLKLN